MTHDSSLVTRLAPWLEALASGLGLGLVVAHEARRRRAQPAGQPQPPPSPRRFPGLERPIDLLYDSRGIPHVRTETTRDLFFGQGYATAADRFWQMDLNRRVASGTLSAIIGPDLEHHDRFVRRVGLRHLAVEAWERLDAEGRSLLEAYAAGVNAYLSERDGWNVTTEHAVLRALGLVRQRAWLPEPDPWTPVDSLTFGSFMAWVMSVGWDSELVRLRLIARVGEEHFQEIDPAPPEAKPIHVPSGIDWAAVDTDLGTFPDLAIWSGPAASNNWAVSGERSTTGKPLLANDMHLLPRVPVTWYEVHLMGEELNAIGASIPGIPGILVGHNGHVAWGVTAAFPDVMDLVVERFSNRGMTYEGPDGPRDVEVVDESIDVLGSASPVIERVRITRAGPVLGRNPSARLQIALRSLGSDATPASTLFRMMRAGSAAEFRETLRDWRAPALNFVFADTGGTIGWQFAGSVPRRGRGDGLLPVPGWDAAYDWQGTIPFDDLPHSLAPAAGSHESRVTSHESTDLGIETRGPRPETQPPNRRTSHEGIVWSANNDPRYGGHESRVTSHESADPEPKTRDSRPETRDLVLGFEFMDRFRAQRIVDLVRRTPLHSLDSFRAIQRDAYCIPGKALVTLLARVAFGPEPSDERETLALALLRSWDGFMTTDSVGAAVYAVLRSRLIDRFLLRNGGLLIPEYLGLGPTDPALPISSYGFRFASHLLALLRRRLDDPATAADTLADVRGALRETIDFLRETSGRDPGTWSWGALHQVELRHAFNALPFGGRIFGLGLIPYPGEDDTLVQSGVGPAGMIPPRRSHQPLSLHHFIPPYLAVGGFVPSYRFIADLADLGRSRSVLPTGQSGHVRSRHYADQLQAWLNHDDYPLRYSWFDIVDNTWRRVRLMPKREASGRTNGAST